MTFALLGYGINPPEEHVSLAREIGMYLGSKGSNLVCGGYQGTLEAGLNACATAGGKADVVLEAHRITTDVTIHYKVTVVPNTEEKHQTIALHADIAIAIGGGPGSLRLAERVLQADKTVFVCEFAQGDCLPLLGKQGVIGFSDLSSFLQHLQGFLRQ
jgi:hypothetical protein